MKIICFKQRQQGIAVLGMALIMLVVMGLFALMLQLTTMRHLETEAVKYHSEQALQEAEAGLAYGKAYLLHDASHDQDDENASEGWFIIPHSKLLSDFPHIDKSEADVIDNPVKLADRDEVVFLIRSVAVVNKIKRQVQQEVKIIVSGANGEKRKLEVVPNSWSDINDAS